LLLDLPQGPQDASWAKRIGEDYFALGVAVLSLFRFLSSQSFLQLSYQAGCLGDTEMKPFSSDWCGSLFAGLQRIA
jgi:hypothetical protein